MRCSATHRPLSGLPLGTPCGPPGRSDAASAPSCSDWKAHKQTCKALANGCAAPAPKPPKPTPPPPWKPFAPDPVVEQRIDAAETTCIPCIGLANIGNTCFLNCILQCLLHGPLWHYLVDSSHKKTCSEPACIVCDMVDLVRQYAACGKGKWIAPRTVARRMLTEESGLDFGRMHDSHEFMVMLLAKLLDSNLMGAPEHESHDMQDAQECQTLMHHLYGSLLVNVVECEGCGHTTPGRAERSVAFLLPMEPQGGGAKPAEEPSTGLRAWVRGAAQRVGEKVGVVEGASKTIEDLIRYFITPVELEDYKCDGCGLKNAGVDGKRICMRESLADAPRVLVLAVKRFSGGNFGKINTPVTFEQTLDLAPFIEATSMDSVGGEGSDTRRIWAEQQKLLPPGPCVYRLTGVVVHRGLMKSVNAGHYTACVRSGDDWLLIDDEEVTKTTWETVSGLNVYMLFYRKLADDATGGEGSSAASSSADAAASSEGAEGAEGGASSVGGAPGGDESSGAWGEEPPVPGLTGGMSKLHISESSKAEGRESAGGDADADDEAGSLGDAPEPESPTARPPALAKAGSSSESVVTVQACPLYELVELSDVAKAFDGAAHCKLSVALPEEASLDALAGAVRSEISAECLIFETPAYKLRVEWPSRIDVEQSKAQFARQTRTLTVRAPVERSN